MARLVRVALVASAGLLLLATAGSTARQPLRYVALGDSFSSGEGNPPYRPSTDSLLLPHDLCHRSYAAYPQLVADRVSATRDWSFWACSGARISDMTSPNHQNPVEPAQLDRIAPPGRSNRAVDLITLTIGGNDAQFGSVWITCLASHAVSLLLGTCNESWRSRLADAINGLRTSLPPVFRALRARAPRARIVVLGYPDPFPIALSPSSRCTDWFAPADIRFLGRTGASLDGAIRAAARASRARVTYVSPTGFAGHDACSRRPWFNGLRLDPTRVRGSFHPNAAGQRQLAKDVLGAL
jgi:lysophospholipase L1-like esterase